MKVAETHVINSEVLISIRHFGLPLVFVVLCYTRIGKDPRG